jgi:hypothetical protein
MDEERKCVKAKDQLGRGWQDGLGAGKAEGGRARAKSDASARKQRASAPRRASISAPPANYCSAKPYRVIPVLRPPTHPPAKSQPANLPPLHSRTHEDDPHSCFCRPSAVGWPGALPCFRIEMRNACDRSRRPLPGSAPSCSAPSPLRATPASDLSVAVEDAIESVTCGLKAYRRCASPPAALPLPRAPAARLWAGARPRLGKTRGPDHHPAFSTRGVFIYQATTLCTYSRHRVIREISQ